MAAATIASGRIFEASGVTSLIAQVGVGALTYTASAWFLDIADIRQKVSAYLTGR